MHRGIVVLTVTWYNEAYVRLVKQVWHVYRHHK